MFETVGKVGNNFHLRAWRQLVLNSFCAKPPPFSRNPPGVLGFPTPNSAQWMSRRTPWGFGNWGGERTLATKVWLSCFCGFESESSENVVRALWSNRSSPPACLTQGDECPQRCSAVVGAQPQLSQVEAETEAAAGLKAEKRVGVGSPDSLGQPALRALKELFIQQDPGSHLHTSAPHRLLGCISRDQRPLKVAFSSLSPTAQLVHYFKIIPGGEGLKFALHRTYNKMRSSEAGVTIYLCEISLIALNSLLCKMWVQLVTSL